MAKFTSILPNNDGSFEYNMATFSLFQIYYREFRVREWEGSMGQFQLGGTNLTLRRPMKLPQAMHNYKDMVYLLIFLFLFFFFFWGGGGDITISIQSLITSQLLISVILMSFL